METKPTVSNIIRVKLIKDKNHGLGFLIRDRSRIPNVVVSDLIRGEIAAVCGLVQIGDVVLKVNEHDLLEKTYEQSVEILKSIAVNSSAVLVLKAPEGYTSHLETRFSEDGTPRTIRITKPCVHRESLLNRIRKALTGITSTRASRSRQVQAGVECVSISQHISDGNIHSQSKTSDGRTPQPQINIQNQRNRADYSDKVCKRCNINSQDGCVHAADDTMQNDNTATLNNKTSVLKFETKTLGIAATEFKETKIKVTDTAEQLESDIINTNNTTISHIVMTAESNKTNNLKYCNDISAEKVNVGEAVVHTAGQSKEVDTTKKHGTQSTMNNENGDSEDTTQIQKVSVVEPGSLDTVVNIEDAVNTPAANVKSDVKNKDETASANKTPKMELEIINPTILGRSRSIQKSVKLRNVADERPVTCDTLHAKALEPTHCTRDVCQASLMDALGVKTTTPRSKDDILVHAKDFIAQYYESIKRNNTRAHTTRWEEVEKCMENTGTYELTMAELTFGAKTAWRNAQRCIGRIQWSKLQVFDARHITTARGMFEAICNHIKYGTNKGHIRSAITVFPARTDGKNDFRVWNPQLVRYAGYKQDDGSIIGDPANVEITEVCLKMGWKGKGTRFDVLPLVLQANGHDPEVFEIPHDLVLEVQIRHPKYSWFSDLGLRWYALPAVSGLMFDCGGLEFTCAPFNGWFMGTEIGARDLCDKSRYDVLKEVATKMGLDTRKSSSLWRDRSLVEVNVAVLHSYQTQGVTITDHHAAAESFMKHLDNEQRLRGGCPADWVWVVPPMSASLLPVFHQEMLSYKLKPSYEYQEDTWKTYVWAKDREKNAKRESGDKPRRKIGFRELARAVKFSAKLMMKALARRVKCIILYGTETGKSEGFAKMLWHIFKHTFDANVICMDEYDVSELQHQTLVLIVTSTFGNGDPPESGETFARAMHEMKNPESSKNKQDGQGSYLRLSSTSDRDMCTCVPTSSVEDNLTQDTGPLSNVRYSVFGLGSRSYPNFCAFGHFMDNIFADLGAERIYSMAEGDELCGQEESFRNWAEQIFKAACETFCVGDEAMMTRAVDTLSKTDSSWSQNKFRLTISERETVSNTVSALSQVHGKSIVPCKILERVQLRANESDRQTILVKLDTQVSSELVYNPGDHVAIFPENSPKLVDAILIRLHNAPPRDVPVKIEVNKERTTPFGTKQTWEDFRKFPVMTMRTAFSRFLDITTPPSRTLLKIMAAQAEKDCDRQCLENLANDANLYDEWKHEHYPNMVQVLDQFPSLKIPPSLFITQLPLLQQRFYSISSSAKCYPGEIHITVAVVSFRTGNSGPIHEGVCSTWLNTLGEGATVPCLVRHAPAFQMPSDGTRPMILVGPGTGIAPFRSFWQQRKIDMDMAQEAQRGSWGDVYLYFGCRRSDTDDIYKEELALMKKDGVLKAVYTALSREPDQPSTYVQNILLKNAADTYRTIFRDGGHFYVCGDVKMAFDVTATLEKIIMIEGQMTASDASNYILHLRDTYRFHEDIFGVTLRNSEVTDKARDQAKKAWNYIKTSNSMSNHEKETVTPIHDDDQKAPEGRPKPPQKLLYGSEVTKL